MTEIKEIVLEWKGPYNIIDKDNSNLEILTKKEIEVRGIYLWTFFNTKLEKHFVYYVGKHEKNILERIWIEIAGCFGGNYALLKNDDLANNKISYLYEPSLKNYNKFFKEFDYYFKEAIQNLKYSQIFFSEINEALENIYLSYSESAIINYLRSKYENSNNSIKLTNQKVSRKGKKEIKLKFKNGEDIWGFDNKIFWEN